MNTLPKELQNAIREFETQITPQKVNEAFSLTPDAFAERYAQWLSAAGALIRRDDSAARRAMDAISAADLPQKASLFTALFCCAMHQQRAAQPNPKPLSEYLRGLLRKMN